MPSLFEAPPLALGALHEEYRPQSWADVVGQDAVLARIAQLGRTRGVSGRAWWITGASGTGKTTIARLLAAEVADEFAIEEIDAERLTSARLKELERQSACRAIGAKSGRAYIVNEAHGLASDTVRQLLVAIEGDRIPRHVIWIFTTTCDGQERLENMDDGGPLLSRCTRLKLARRDLSRPFAERLQAIARAAGVESGQPIEKYVKLLQSCQNNMRAALSEIEAGAFLS